MLEISDQIGSLTPGKRADLIILNPRTLNFAPPFRIVFNGQPKNVEWVFVDGRPLKKRGRLVRAKLDAVVQAADRAAARIREDLVDSGYLPE